MIGRPIEVRKNTLPVGLPLFRVKGLIWGTLLFFFAPLFVSSALAEPGARVDFAALKELASAHPETFDTAFQRKLTEVEKLLASGSSPQATKLAVQALDQQACRKTEGKHSFEVPQVQSETQFSALSLLSSENPEAIKRIASQQIIRIREQFLDEVALRPAQERLEKDYLGSKPQPPASAPLLKKLHDEAHQAILQPEALNGAAQDTPDQVKALKASRGDRLRLNDEALQQSLRDLPGKEAAYQAALQKWKTRDRATLDQAFQILKKQGREALFRKDPQARREWETFKRNHPSFVAISNSLNELGQKASHDPKAALSLLQAQPILRSIATYARLWSDGLVQYPDQKKRSVDHADALRDLVRHVSLDAQNGKVHAITHYSSAKMADVLTGYDMDRLKNEISDDAWFAADAVGAAAVAIGTLGAGTPLLAASLSTLGLLETGASLVHSAQRKNPDLPLSQQFQDPEIALHAALFVATLPLESLSNLAKSERLALAAKRFYSDPKKAEIFIQAARKSATGFQVAKNGYFSVLSAESLARAALLCSNADSQSCLQNFGIALLQAIPGGTDAYRSFHRKSCPSGPKGEDAPVCIPEKPVREDFKTLSTEMNRVTALFPMESGGDDGVPGAPLQRLKANHERSEGQRLVDQMMLQEFKPLNPLTDSSVKRLREVRARNLSLGRSSPTADEVRAARELRDRLKGEAKVPKLGESSKTLIDWLESEYGLRSGKEIPWEPESLLKNILKLQDKMDSETDGSSREKYRSEIIASRKVLGNRVEEQLKASGIKYEALAGNRYQISATQGDSPLNRMARRMKKLHQVDLIYDPIDLHKTQAEAVAQGSTIFVSHRSIQTGMADAAIGHEVRHVILRNEQALGKSGTFGAVMSRDNTEVPILPRYRGRQYYPQYQQQEFVTFSYTLKHALASLQNPRASPSEQAEARKKIYLSLHVMQNLAKSDRYALSRMVKRLKSVSPEDSDRVFALSQDENQSAYMGLHVRTQGINLMQLVPPYFRDSFQAVEAAQKLLNDKRLAGDLQEILLAESRLRGAQAKLKSEVIEHLQGRLEFARKIDQSLGSATLGVLSIDHKGRPTSFPLSPVRWQHSKPLSEALVKRILAPTVLIEERWKTERR